MLTQNTTLFILLLPLFIPQAAVPNAAGVISVTTVTDALDMNDTTAPAVISMNAEDVIAIILVAIHAEICITNLQEHIISILQHLIDAMQKWAQEKVGSMPGYLHLKRLKMVCKDWVALMKRFLFHQGLSTATNKNLDYF
jgi:hypothetical protein